MPFLSPWMLSISFCTLPTKPGSFQLVCLTYTSFRTTLSRSIKLHLELLFLLGGSYVHGSKSIELMSYIFSSLFFNKQSFNETSSEQTMFNVSYYTVMVFKWRYKAIHKHARWHNSCVNKLIFQMTGLMMDKSLDRRLSLDSQKWNKMFVLGLL